MCLCWPKRTWTKYLRIIHKFERKSLKQLRKGSGWWQNVLRLLLRKKKRTKKEKKKTSSRFLIIIFIFAQPTDGLIEINDVLNQIKRGSLVKHLDHDYTWDTLPILATKILLYRFKDPETCYYLFRKKKKVSIKKLLLLKSPPSLHQRFNNACLPAWKHLKPVWRTCLSTLSFCLIAS